MIINYFKTAFRNLVKNKLHSLINIVGLTIGIMSFIAISLFILDELSYDTFHTNIDRLYRIVHKDNGVAITPAPLADVLKAENPNIKDVTRIWRANRAVVSTESKNFYEEQIYFTDSNFFEMFTFDLADGNGQTVLADYNTVVLTESMVKKYFPGKDAIGEKITIRNDEYRITGIMKDVPHNSHFHPDFVASFKSLEKYLGLHWGNNMFYTYVLLPENVSPQNVQQTIGPIVAQHTEYYDPDEFELQAARSIHLRSNRGYEIESNGDIKTIYIFASIAVLILLVACINYMNISTAFASIRKKEIGVRKAIGAQKKQIVAQFFSESLLTTLAAFILAIFLLEGFLPFVSQWTGKFFTNSDILKPAFFPFYIGIIVLTTLVSGSYPALFLSAFKPQSVLKSEIATGKKKGLLRGILVMLQFTILIALLICSHFISNQFTFLSNKKLGFQKDHIIIFPMPEVKTDIEIVKHEIESSPYVLKSTFSSDVPGLLRYGWRFSPVGASVQEDWNFNTYVVDVDFVDTYDVEILEGRGFSKSIMSDLNGACILNEAAVAKFDIESPVGKKVQCLGLMDHPEATIIGIARDFHYQSLHQKVEPCVLYLGPQMYQYLSVKMSSRDVPAAIQSIKDTFAELLPNRPFEYQFLDAKLDVLYKSEARMKNIINTFSIIAIIIACLGFFGLASFIAQQKTKEIGIRKVMGATAMGMLFYINKDLNKWVLLANLVSWPVAWLVMHRWLQSFAYHIEVRWWVFVLAGVIALLIAFVSVSYQAIKAATANPIEALRYE